jgi:hypothetical protein
MVSAKHSVHGTISSAEFIRYSVPAASTTLAGKELGANVLVPFAYSVQNSGTVHDSAGMGNGLKQPK